MSDALTSACRHQCPDDVDVDGDQDDRPDWVIREEHEACDRAERRQDHAYNACPDHAEQHADSGGEHDGAECEVRPAPVCDIPVVGVRRADGYEERLLDHNGEPDQEAPDSAHDHEDAGEHGAGRRSDARWRLGLAIPRVPSAARVSAWLLIRGRTGAVFLAAPGGLADGRLPTRVAHSRPLIMSVTGLLLSTLGTGTARWHHPLRVNKGQVSAVRQEGQVACGPDRYSRCRMPMTVR